MGGNEEPVEVSSYTKLIVKIYEPDRHTQKESDNET